MKPSIEAVPSDVELVKSMIPSMSYSGDEAVELKPVRARRVRGGAYVAERATKTVQEAVGLAEEEEEVKSDSSSSDAPFQTSSSDSTSD